MNSNLYYHKRLKPILQNKYFIYNLIDRLKHNKLKENYFSLIELLVVLSVVTILFSLVFKSLSKTNQLARGMVCTNSLKIVNQASSYYQEDFDGNFIRQLSRSSGSKKGYFWPEMMVHLNYCGDQGLNDESLAKLLNCPERTATPRRDRPPWGYNLSIGNWASNDFYSENVNNLISPHKKFIFVENSLLLTKDALDWGFFMMNKSLSKSRFAPLHLDKGNISFGDGHIESLDIFDLSLLNDLPKDEGPWLPN